MNRDRQDIKRLRNYESLVTDPKWSQHSKWSGRFPLSDHEHLEAAYFMQVKGDPRVYLVENITAHEKVVNGVDPHVEASGREASALLHARTIAGTLREANRTPAYLANQLFNHLSTTSRGIAGLSLDTSLSYTGSYTIDDWQRSWGDMGAVFLDLMESAGYGFYTYLDSSKNIRIVIQAPVYNDANVGAKYGNATGARLVRGISDWRNYAYVLGEGEGSTRRQVIVDQRGGQERRELYVDARDLQQTVDGTTYTNAQYDAMLAQRGREKLAETRIVEYAEASTSAPLSPGDVVWYDTARWSGFLMVTGAPVTREGGKRQHGVSLGEAPTTIGKVIRRLR